MNDLVLSVAIRRSVLEGEIVAPPSKSMTHRALICAALADGTSTIHNPLLCDDTEATLRACETLGAKILTKTEEKIVVCGTGGRIKIRNGEIDCGESGSTLRFITPIVGITDSEAIFRGKNSLARRPIKEMLSILDQFGTKSEFEDGEVGLPYKIKGVAKGIGQKLKVRGDVSSQFISGLLFALPLVEGKSVISISTRLESRDYVEMTLEVLEKFGVKIEKSKDLKNLTVMGGQRYSSTEFWVEGDYSSSAFFLVAGAISGAGKGVTVRNLRRDSRQGDRRIVNILREMGGDIEVNESSVTVRKSGLSGIEINARDIPDLVPIIAVAGTQSEGAIRIDGIRRLRLKESDRFSAIDKLIKKFGCNASIGNDSVTLDGKCELRPGASLNFDDHRMVMASCIGGLVANGETRVGNPLAIKKSYPEFFDHLRKLGGDVMTISNSIGSRVKLSVFGESHGKRIGAFLDGIPKGFTVEREFVQSELEKRRSTSSLTTPRRESDRVEIVSGIKSNRTTGETIILEIKNTDVKSEYYEMNKDFIRPGHADFTARQKYASVFDYRGGGFLSGRMTACFVAAGAISKKVLESRGIKVLSHIVQIGKVRISSDPTDEEIEYGTYPYSVLCSDPKRAEAMEKAIGVAKRQGDSLGGIVECRIIGLPVGVGEPIFHSIEGAISQAMFSIPAVKGIEFGSGFRGSESTGSENNDPVSIRDGKVVMLSNNSGGILGGISNGMPVVFRVAIKPTSSIAKEQQTINYSRSENVTFSVKGRHDPCIAVRAPPVVEAMSALTIVDLLMEGGFLDGS